MTRYKYPPLFEHHNIYIH